MHPLDQNPNSEPWTYNTMVYILYVNSDAGLRINSLGGETELDVQRYSYSGNAKRSLKSAEVAKKAGVTVREVTGNITSGKQQSSFLKWSKS